MQETGRISRARRAGLCRVCMGLCLLVQLTGCHAVRRQEMNVPAPDISGRFEICADTLRMRSVQVQMPELMLLDHTGQDEPGGKWRVTMQGRLDCPDLWQLRLEQSTDAVRRRIDYLIYIPSDAAGTPHLEPVMATETAFDLDAHSLLYRSQSVDWSIKDLVRGSEQAVDLARAVPWIRDHLQRVFSPEILDLCAEYFWHNSPSSSFSEVIACTNRRIELAPQVVEPYTTNAWLMWSEWVSWTLDPKKMPKGKGQVDEAIRLIRKGRAANPHSAEYHLDAAETIAPLAHHHRPELMDFVIRYYLYAEELATDRDMQIRIRKGLGHRFREQDKIPEAIQWYRAVLALDPDNRVALRYLENFGAASRATPPEQVGED